MSVLPDRHNSHLHRVTYTKWCIDAIRCSWWWAQCCSKHVEKGNKEIYWKKCVMLVINENYTEIHGQWNKRDRDTQYVCNVIIITSVQPFLQWKSNSYYSFLLCVCSLGYPTCKAHAPYCRLWPAQLYNIFPHYLVNGAIFEGKKLLKMKCV